jgi:hypothetical protein
MAGSSGCVAFDSVASVDRSLLADGVSMFVPVSMWAHACACATCLAKYVRVSFPLYALFAHLVCVWHCSYEAFDVSHLRLRVAEPDSDSEDDDEPEPCAPLAPLAADIATTPSSVSGLSATPTFDAVATAMQGCSSPVVMCGLETAGLDALRSLPVPAQAAALSKFNAFSEQLRTFLKVRICEGLCCHNKA